jgi:signal transduction histidine kinase
MASDRPLRVLAAGGLAAALGLVFVAGGQSDTPRVMVLLLVGAALCLGAALHGRERLHRRALNAAAQPPALSIDQQGLVDNALAYESRLEHAPIALFRIDGAAGEGRTVPMNANARKLVAPGRAVDPHALYRQLAALPVHQRGMIGFDTERGGERALVSVAALALQGQQQRLAALMPVESELEAEALNAWRQLVHVLTHEIMNSLTPVASLSRTARDLLDEFRDALPADAGADLVTALDAISRRADSLVAFVNSYRSLSNVPEPAPEHVRVAELFARVAALVGPGWKARGGRVEFSVEPASLELVVDPGQLEQALINLVKNAADATAQVADPQALVTARLVRGGRLRIEVSDNGPGVPDDLVAHIFTPFFTTRKQGSGIGLAMVRQLVHGNGGTVRYAKSVSAGARFVISF